MHHAIQNSSEFSHPNSDPDVEGTDYKNLLEQMSTAALQTISQRSVYGYDTTYDHFMWDYVGDPFGNNKPEIVHSNVHYDTTVITSHTEGYLVQVRTATTEPLAEQGAANPRHYYVASANVATGAVKEWNVAEVLHSQKSLGSLSTELILNDPALEEAPSAGQQFTEMNLLEDILAERGLMQATRRWQASRARVVLGGQGCTFNEANCHPEEMSPIQEVHTQLSSFYKSFGHLAVAQAFSHRTGIDLARIA